MRVVLELFLAAALSATLDAAYVAYCIQSAYQSPGQYLVRTAAKSLVVTLGSTCCKANGGMWNIDLSSSWSCIQATESLLYLSKESSAGSAWTVNSDPNACTSSTNPRQFAFFGTTSNACIKNLNWDQVIGVSVSSGFWSFAAPSATGTTCSSSSKWTLTTSESSSCVTTTASPSNPTSGTYCIGVGSKYLTFPAGAKSVTTVTTTSTCSCDSVWKLTPSGRGFIMMHCGSGLYLWKESTYYDGWSMGSTYYGLMTWTGSCIATLGSTFMNMDTSTASVGTSCTSSWTATAITCSTCTPTTLPPTTTGSPRSGAPTPAPTNGSVVNASGGSSSTTPTPSRWTSSPQSSSSSSLSFTTSDGGDAATDRRPIPSSTASRHRSETPTLRLARKASPTTPAPPPPNPLRRGVQKNEVGREPAAVTVAVAVGYGNTAVAAALSPTSGNKASATSRLVAGAECTLFGNNGLSTFPQPDDWALIPGLEVIKSKLERRDDGGTSPAAAMVLTTVSVSTLVWAVNTLGAWLAFRGSRR